MPGSQRALYSTSTLKMNDCKQIDIPGTISLSLSLSHTLSLLFSIAGLIFFTLSFIHTLFPPSAFPFFEGEREMRENINNKTG